MDFNDKENNCNREDSSSVKIENEETEQGEICMEQHEEETDKRKSIEIRPPNITNQNTDEKGKNCKTTDLPCGYDHDDNVKENNEDSAQHRLFGSLSSFQSTIQKAKDNQNDDKPKLLISDLLKKCSVNDLLDEFVSTNISFEDDPSCADKKKRGTSFKHTNTDPSNSKKNKEDTIDYDKLDDDLYVTKYVQKHCHALKHKKSRDNHIYKDNVKNDTIMTLNHNAVREHALKVLELVELSSPTALSLDSSFNDEEDEFEERDEDGVYWF